MVLRGFFISLMLFFIDLIQHLKKHFLNKSECVFGKDYAGLAQACFM